MSGSALARAAGETFATVLLFHEAPEGERPPAAVFRGQVLARLEEFGKSAEAQTVPPGDVEAARFALTAWTDEVVNLSEWNGTVEWERNPLQLQIFGTRRAGLEFYERLEKLRPENAAALEVYFYCLALGYQGDYAGREGDRQVVVQRTLEKLRKLELALDVGRQKRLTPRAYEVSIQVDGRRSPLLRILFAVGVAASLLFGFLWGALHLLAGRVPLLVGG